jgi:16S rRNA (guanine527-N7)-methyltransferase
MSKLINKYFPHLPDKQADSLESLYPLYLEWNSKINVISRKDVHNFEEHHLLHSLAIAKVVKFGQGAKVMDAGTGGGFPGIPLAILFPDVSFTLVDSIRKKNIVSENIASELGLNNVRVLCSRIEEINEQFDFIVSRAVTAFPKFVSWTLPKLKPGNNSSLSNGILYLKGGDLREELSKYIDRVKIYELDEFFDEEFFREKKLVYLPR